MKKVNQKGFSIIEVLIVLAIAGLIMLVVFLAVPSLQRNARNNGRQSDASKFAAAVNQCLANNNGIRDNCDQIANNEVRFDLNEYSQLTTTPTPGAATFNANQTGDTTTIVWAFGTRCNGSLAETSTSRREFTVRYQVEGSGGAQNVCLGS